MSKITSSDATRNRRILNAVREVHDWRLATCPDRDDMTDALEAEWLDRLEKAYNTK